jgi:hypothetical protein
MDEPLALTLGAIQMGVIVSSVLWGVACVQFYIYLVSTTKEDRPLLKTFVSAVLLVFQRLCRPM